MAQLKPFSALQSGIIIYQINIFSIFCTKIKRGGNDEIKKQIAARDKFDSSRTHSPLRKAKDAIEIDTSSLSIEEQTEKVVELARSIIEK